jgi:hypothetical protein
VVCEDVALFRVLGIDPGGGGRNPIVFPAKPREGKDTRTPQCIKIYTKYKLI